MGWNGAGVFNRLYSWVADANAGIDINASRMDADTDDITSNGLGNCLTRDGQGVATANLPMAGFRHTGVGSGVASTDYARLDQVQSGAASWCGTAGGTANAITLTPAPAITGYAAGQKFRFIYAGPNTNAVTVAVSGLTAQALQKNGSALVSGDLISALMEIEYDGTNFQIIAVANLVTTSLAQTLSNKTIASPTVTGTLSGHIIALVDSTATLLTIDSSNTAGPLASWRTSGTDIGYVGSSKAIFSGGALADFGIGTNGTHNLVLGNGGTIFTTIDTSGRNLIGKAANFSGSTGLLQVNAPDGGQGILLGNISGASATLMIAFINSNGQVGGITSTGSATAYATSSDYRIKNIEEKFSGALDMIDRIPVYLGSFKSTPDYKRPMILAHEFQQVLPHAVFGEKDAVKDIGDIFIDIGELYLQCEEEEENKEIKICSEPETIPDGYVWKYRETIHSETNAACPAIIKKGYSWKKTGTVEVHQMVDTSMSVELLLAGIQELRAEFNAYKASHP